jgi:cell division protein FtsL
MTTARQAVRAAAPRTAPKAAPARKEAARPPLRVVRAAELSARGRRRRARLMGTAITLVVVGGLFALAVFNVVLAQGQVRLNTIEDKANAQQDRYERLRLEVAQLESPERVVAAAQERLGMVPPATVHYLAPQGTAPRGVNTGDAKVAAAAPPVTTHWAQVKPHLAAQP